MPDRFIPLHEFVSPAAVEEPETEPVQAAAEPQAVEQSPQTQEAVADVRRFRAAVRDAVAVAARGVLCDVAAEVLARELELAPSNIEAIVTRACLRHEDERIAFVRVHPDEAAQLAAMAIDVVSDSGLRRGDAVLHVRSGTIDMTLGARLAGVLDGAEP